MLEEIENPASPQAQPLSLLLVFVIVVILQVLDRLPLLESLNLCDNRLTGEQTADSRQLRSTNYVANAHFFQTTTLG